MKDNQKKERATLLKELKAKYGAKDVTLRLINSLVDEHKLNELEIEYIFFEDSLLERIIKA